MGYIVIFKRLAGILNVALLVQPMVHSVAALSVISVSYFNYLMMASETPRIYAMFGCKFTPRVEK